MKALSNLTRLANEYGTDKGTSPHGGHGYSLLYDLLFDRQRLDQINLCEVGLSIGGPEFEGVTADRAVANVPSIRMWQDYFPHANIVGVDISDCSAFVTDRFQFVRADCGDKAQLEKVADLGMQFDIIIDDGSHASYHQQLTFLTLFPLLKPTGLYIIEDLQWQPDTYEWTLPKVPRTDLLLQRYLRDGRFADTGALSEAEWAKQAAQIKSLTVYDEEWFNIHRRQFNLRNGLLPDAPNNFDRTGRGWKTLRNLLGRITKWAKTDYYGPDYAKRWPRMKLAVIQKEA